MLVAVPPLSSGTFQVISRECDIVGRGYISRVQLESDVVEPVISIKGLSWAAVDDRVETRKVLQGYWGWLLIHIGTRKLSHDSYHELAIQHQSVVSFRPCIQAVTTSGSNHPA